jgi:hypothetical protein
MKLRQKVALIFWMVILGAIPAWANNPPQPDGLFSLILIFPIVIFGFRLAGASYTEGQRKWRWLRGILLGLAVIVAMAGTEIASIPLLVLLIFGLWRGIQIVKRGQGRKRILVGALVCLWTLFAVSDYWISLLVWSRVPLHQAMTIENLRKLSDAEQVYVHRAGFSGYGTIEQMRDAGTPLQSEWGDSGSAAYDPYLRDSFFGYHYNSVVDPDGKKFLITAVPTVYEKDITPVPIPGASLWTVLRSLGHKRNPNGDSTEVGQRSFAIDETGVIRATDLGTTRPVTREEVEKWKPVGAR